MRIAVDLDGTTYEFHRTVRYMLNHYRACALPPVEEFWTDWDSLYRWVGSADINWLWTEGVKLGLFRYGHVTTGAILGLRELVADGNEIVVATHRPEQAVQDTLDWISYLRLPWSGVHILSNGEPKTSVTADILIDDKPQNIAVWVGEGRKTLVYDRPWNTDVPETPKSIRVKRWEDIPGVVRDL